MILKFSPREHLINSLILHSTDINIGPGLLTGQMGILITIAQYARTFDCPQIESVSDFLLDTVIHSAKQLNHISFESGLCGICWGVEYLIENNFLNGRGDDFCCDVDNRIIEVNLNKFENIDYSEGLFDIWHYVWARIQGNLKANLRLPFPSDYINQWISIISQKEQNFPADAKLRLFNALHGRLIYKPLKLNSLICNNDFTTQDSYALKTGIAGYLVTHYLKDI